MAQDSDKPDWQDVGVAIAAVALSLAKVGQEADPTFAKRFYDDLDQRAIHLMSLQNESARLMLGTTLGELRNFLAGRSNL